MVSFDSLLSVQGCVSVPAVHGSLVFWLARCFGGFAVSLGACSFSEYCVPRVFVA